MNVKFHMNAARGAARAYCRFLHNWPLDIEKYLLHEPYIISAPAGFTNSLTTMTLVNWLMMQGMLTPAWEAFHHDRGGYTSRLNIITTTLKHYEQLYRARTRAPDDRACHEAD